MPPYRSTPRGPSLAEQFGFDITQRHRAVFQLRDILNLDRHQFAELKEKMLTIVTRHFDINEPGRPQHEAMEMIIDDLKSQLPAWFKKGNIKQREYFLRSAVFNLHTYRRKKKHLRDITIKRKASKKENENDVKSDTDNHSDSQKDKKKLIPRVLSVAKPGLSLTQRMQASLLSVINGTPAPKIFASPMRAPRAVFSDSPATTRLPLSDISRSLGRPHRSQVLPTQTPNHRHVNPSSFSSFTLEPGPSDAQIPPPSLARGPSQTDRSIVIKAVKTPFSIPGTSSGVMVASSSASTSRDGTQGTSVARMGQIRSVHNFLEAAKPPMTHLLHRFIEFGCHREDFLFAVSMWSSERIRTFLKSLPGKALTKMEVDILVYHFESYFLASNNV